MNDNIATVVVVTPLCPHCASFVGNALSTVDLKNTPKGIEHRCDNCTEVFYVPYALIRREARMLTGGE